MTSPDPDRARAAILAGVLAHAPFDGWTWRTVEAAAKDAGYQPTACDGNRRIERIGEDPWRPSYGLSSRRGRRA